jgi:hypothetical protein
MRFIGNAIAGANTGSGFSLSLAYNVANNKQFWMGDPDFLGNAAGTFIWYLTYNGSSIIEAVAGDNSGRRPMRIGVGGDPNSVVILGDDGNSAIPGSYVWADGNMAIGNGYRANAAPTNGLIVQGNVGIGTSTPSTALHVVATANPLTLIGVQVGATTDSILTIASGTVRKLPFTTLTSGASWSLTGNAGTNYGTNFLGTTDNTSLRFRTNNTQGMILDSLGNLGVGKTVMAYRVDVHGRGNFDSTLNAPNYTSIFQTLSFGSTITWDQTKGATSGVTLTGNATLAITNAVAGMYGLIRVTQDATGSRTLTLPGSSRVINGGGGAVVLTTTAGATDVLSYFYDGANYYWTVGYNYN